MVGAPAGQGNHTLHSVRDVLRTLRPRLLLLDPGWEPARTVREGLTAVISEGWRPD
jgi:hypothetical protein